MSSNERKSVRKGHALPFAILLSRLEVPVTVLARRLHVDASLVSKWKNGQRRLSEHSVHFGAVLDFFVGEDEGRTSRVVEVLKELNPLDSLDNEGAVRSRLQSFLLGGASPPLEPAGPETSCAAAIAKVLIYEGGRGCRDAVSELLDLAEAMPEPGRIVFTECEQYRWLLEDPQYIRLWRDRVYRLLERGFRATFILHFTVYHEQFFHFFRVCSPLLFHRNVDWHYHEYYDAEVHWFSFFILEHARSVMGLSMGPGHCDTTVFTDARSIAQHKRVVEMVRSASRPLFTDFPQGRILPSLGGLLRSDWQDGAMFAFLPVPVFAATDPALLEEILVDNGVGPAMIRRCLKENRLLDAIVERQTRSGNALLVSIYQLEEMRRRIDEGGFESCSLTLMAGRPVRVNLDQYARGLLHVTCMMKRNPGAQVVLASKEDHNQLPGLNCWCKGREWMVQMDSHGVRFSREDVMVRAASAALEWCLRKIPPARKQQGLVARRLMAMVEDIRKRSVGAGGTPDW